MGRFGRPLAALFLIILSGCGTIQDLIYEQRVYGGVRRDVELRSFPKSGPIGNDPTFLLLIIDLPFCFVADTLLLFYTIPLNNSRQREQKERPEQAP